MAQRPKEHVRAGMVAAAASLFAEAGFEATTMADVAERAGTSVGNVYKYFAGKEELFREVVPDEFVVTLRRMTKLRVKAFGRARNLSEIAPDARYHVLSGELLEYCLAHRERVIIVLGRGRGTPYASFADQFAKSLVRWALAYVKHAWPEIRPSPSLRFALSQIYANFIAAVTAALATSADTERVREMVFHLTAHHQGGLLRLFETAMQAGART
jgi:AcrR family transcriptional regulator